MTAADHLQIPTQLPGFQIHGDPNWQENQERLWAEWKAEKERLSQQEQQQWHDASELPPMEKAVLNWVATAPARAVLGLLAVSGPGRRAEAEEQMRQLRPLKCTPAEEQACEAVEQMFDAVATTLAPIAAEALLAGRSMVALARAGAREAGHGVEFAAAEQALGIAEQAGGEVAEIGDSRVKQLVAQIGDRLNPMNYEIRGLGSNFGNVVYRGPRPSRTVEIAAEHEMTAAVPQAEESASLPGRHGALEQAKRDLGIPRSQQPDSIGYRDLETRSGKKILDKDGNIIRTREYIYTTPEGEQVIIQEHSAGHVFHDKDGTVSRQGPHFNVRPIDDPRTGKVDGTEPHYPFNK
jgi:hypothetical protein